MKIPLTLRKEIVNGGRVPRGWRMAWYEPRRHIGIYALAPLHWLIRLSREIAHRLRYALQAPAIERAEVSEMERTHWERQLLAAEYSRGYLTGWRECFEACLVAVEDELTRPDGAWDLGVMRTGTSSGEREN